MMPWSCRPFTATPENLIVLGLYARSRTPMRGKSGVDTHERGGILLVVGAAQALAKSTTGVEAAGEAERAAAAKSEALAPWIQGETGREVETLWEGKREDDEPRPESLS
jgi:hypothetical protein